jgi:transposase InsO family protein
MVDRPFGTNIKPTMPNEVISMDLIDFGKQYISIRNYRYVLVIVDHYTSYTWTYLLENRKDLMKPINEWYQFIKTQNKDYPVKTILADGEFITNKLVSFCSANGIKHDTSEPYVSKHNGMCERTNRSIEEMVRCILFDSSFSINYWCYAVDYAVYIINRLGKARLKWQSPFSQYFGNAMFHRLTHIRKFGSVGWMRRNPKKNSSRDKLSNRAIRV